MRIQYLKEGSPTPPDFEADDYPIEGDMVSHSWESPKFPLIIRTIEGRVVKTEWVSHTSVSQHTLIDIDAVQPIASKMDLATSIVVKITLEDDLY